MAKRDTGKRTTAPKAPAARRPKGGKDEHEQTWTAVPRVAGSSEKHAFLLVLSGPQLGEVFSLPSRGTLVVGRRDDCDVAIRDASRNVFDI